MIDQVAQAGTFVNNICENTPIPPECKDLPPSLFYFLYKRVDRGTECLSLVLADEAQQIRALDHEEPMKSFIIMDRPQQSRFRARVVCDSRFSYPQYTTSIDQFGVAEFQISSKFSCGEVNRTARDMDNQKVAVCLVLIVIGLFILTVAGISFNKFVFLIAGLILFVLLIFVIFTVFGFALSGWVSTTIIAGVAAITAFIKFVVKKVKEVLNAVATLLTVKIGYTYGAILFPNSPLHERVDSSAAHGPTGRLGHRLSDLLPDVCLSGLHPAVPAVVYRIDSGGAQLRLPDRQPAELHGHPGRDRLREGLQGGELTSRSCTRSTSRSSSP